MPFRLWNDKYLLLKLSWTEDFRLQQQATQTALLNALQRKEVEDETIILNFRDLEVMCHETRRLKNFILRKWYRFKRERQRRRTRSFFKNLYEWGLRHCRRRSARFQYSPLSQQRAQNERSDEAWPPERTADIDIIMKTLAIFPYLYRYMNLIACTYVGSLWTLIKIYNE